MKRTGFFYCVLLLLISFVSCQNKTKVIIEGELSDMKGDTLVLERSEIGGDKAVDTVVVDKNGSFHFQIQKQEYPEFYTLKSKNSSLTLIIDSVGTISIESAQKTFREALTIKGSEENIRLQSFIQRQRETEKKVDQLLADYKSGSVNDSLYTVRLRSIVDEHKKAVIPDIILRPQSLASYYALFQRVGNYSLFNPYTKEDNRYFSAVATYFDQLYPKSPRSKHLHDITLQGLTTLKKNEIARSLSDQSNVVGGFEIELPNLSGKMIRLSSLKGKVVLLDFTAYQAKLSPVHNIALAELYKKYKEKGFEIYQISLDQDEHFWKVSAGNLPWICVFDKMSNRSPYVQKYNVKELPSYFLINREGDVVESKAQIKDIEVSISGLLN
ncbi:MAG: TlpA disulfide reductase family protein [Bacteroidales bacterium]|nr:TlpA disulfide reductase family protein [Bacteroidales bacterium]MDD3161644.1 TlpA disulfide reductase family protein [Bacteroidales bacterium]